MKDTEKEILQSVTERANALSDMDKEGIVLAVTGILIAVVEAAQQAALKTTPPAA